MGFLDELVSYKPRRNKNKSNPGYPVYINDVKVGELVIPPLPWWAKVGIALGVIGGAVVIYERVRRRG